ncbi:NAD(P)/FAD-dependent oxidoreductase, partial [Kitasatospora sp. NPDC059146]
KANEFIAFWLKDGRVLAGMNMNIWDVTDPIRNLIVSKRVVNADRLANPNIPLSEV